MRFSSHLFVYGKHSLFTDKGTRCLTTRYLKVSISPKQHLDLYDYLRYANNLITATLAVAGLGSVTCLSLRQKSINNITIR